MVPAAIVINVNLDGIRSRRKMRRPGISQGEGIRWCNIQVVIRVITSGMTLDMVEKRCRKWPFPQFI